MKNKHLPKFKSIDEESDWWDKKSSAEIFAMSEPVDIQFRLKRRRMTMVSMRIQTDMVRKAKAVGASIDAPYQRVLRFIMERGLDSEIQNLLRDRKVGPKLKRNLSELKVAV